MPGVFIFPDNIQEIQNETHEYTVKCSITIILFPQWSQNKRIPPEKYNLFLGGGGGLLQYKKT